MKKVNETKTDFKTKSINLPNQNIHEGGASTSGRPDGEEDIVLTKRMWVSLKETDVECEKSR